MTALNIDRQRRLTEASEWLVRLRVNADSAATVEDWLVWCERSPDNATAFEEVQRLWGQWDQAYPDKSEVDRLLTATQREPRMSARDWWRESIFMRISAHAPRYVICILLVGLLSVAGIVGWRTWYRASDGMPLQAGASNRTVSLPDGTVVDLAPRTTLIVNFQRGERRLTLAAGEAFFKVHPDKSRPFVVNAGVLDVTAVGTAFDINRAPGLLTVTVEEGVIAVLSPDPRSLLSRAGAWKVGAGSRLVFSEAEATATLSSVQTSSAFSWRYGRLEYVDAPLATVVADIKRYTSYPLEVSDDSVSRLTYTGTVFTSSVDSWLHALPSALPVRVEHQPEGTERIVPAPRN